MNGSDWPGQQVHRRRNPLTGDWVLVSPHRNLRPWLGSREPVDEPAVPSHDAGCYLCAGNLRAGGERNPDYSGPYLFTNDFPALLPEGAARAQAGPGSCHPLFEATEARGTCRVMCFSPDHARALPALSLPEVEAVIDVWCAQSDELGRVYQWVQVFENKGVAMGCSNPHPHCQVWATNYIPTEALVEDERQRAYHASHGSSMLLDYALAEEAAADAPDARVVLKNRNWLAVVPWWAAWPFEVLLLPRVPVQRMASLTPELREDLALALRDLTRRYDALFNCSFPYSMGWHGAPTGNGHLDHDSAHWQLHAHFYPPLLRSATVRKFMVGYEMLAEPQRDLTPEQAARMLREARA